MRTGCSGARSARRRTTIDVAATFSRRLHATTHAVVRRDLGGKHPGGRAARRGTEAHHPGLNRTSPDEELDACRNYLEGYLACSTNEQNGPPRAMEGTHDQYVTGGRTAGAQ